MVPMATSCPAYSSVPVSVSLTISSFGCAYFFGNPQISRPAEIGGSSSRYICTTKLHSSPRGSAKCCAFCTYTLILSPGATRPPRKAHAAWRNWRRLATRYDSAPRRFLAQIRSRPRLRRRNGTQQRHGHADVGDIAGRQREGDRSAAIIGQTMDFRGATAARAPDRLRPLPPFAPAAERCAFTCKLSRQKLQSARTDAAKARAATMRL